MGFDPALLVALCLASRAAPAALTRGLHTVNGSLSDDPWWSVAYFGTGCFWHARAAFLGFPGVLDVRVGYMRKGTARPGRPVVQWMPAPGDIEVAEVSFDPNRLQYTTLAEHYWSAVALAARKRPPEASYVDAVFATGTEQMLALLRTRRQALESRPKAVLPIAQRAGLFIPAVAPALQCHRDKSSGPADAAATNGEVPEYNADLFRRAVARAQSAGGTAFVLFVTYGWRGLLTNWAVHARLSGVRDDQHLVCCLDEELGPWLRDRGRRGCDLLLLGTAWEPGRRTTRYMPTVLRLPLIASLTRAGLHIVITDADALFRRNPLRMLSATGQGMDVVVSPGTWPYKPFRLWTASAVMGFSLWRATPGAAHVISMIPLVPKEEMAKLSPGPDRSMSDQLRMNAFLVREQLRVERKGSGPEGCMRGIIPRTGVRVAFWTRAQVRRDCEGLSKLTARTPTMRVLHCAVWTVTKRYPEAAHNKEAGSRQLSHAPAVMLLARNWTALGRTSTWDEWMFQALDPRWQAMLTPALRAPVDIWKLPK